MLAIDFINNALDCIIRDLTMSLDFDFVYKSANRYGPDHAYFKRSYAYRNCHNIDPQTKCPICIEPFQDNEAKQLLRCGHLYHRSCLQQYEYHSWYDGKFPLFYCDCPCCKKQYQNTN